MKFELTSSWWLSKDQILKHFEKYGAHLEEGKVVIEFKTLEELLIFTKDCDWWNGEKDADFDSSVRISFDKDESSWILNIQDDYDD